MNMLVARRFYDGPHSGRAVERMEAPVTIDVSELAT
jgi:hypothetical protein